ncbi:C40 family peptidase [Actinomadura miaoliensis]|uniref:NlpC/P60 domain-containing protein n=1 Tax=Actinomadura miaoliensis TaxID=430685 RepID=A0ABP7WM62_9ACTN
MSLPLRTACCATTIALALAPGAAVAQPMKQQDRPKKIQSEGGQAIWRWPTAQNRRTRTFGRVRNMHSRGERAGMLATLQRSVRLRRAQMMARWQSRADRAVSYALRQQGRPYVWGGTGRRGFDCSGLVQRAWRRAGVRIPRVAASQYHGIDPKIQRRDLLPGDLVFFNRLSHVGMYVGDGRFVHSPRPGRHVTVERLRGHYRSRYVGAVRPAWRRLPPVPTRLY